MGSEAKCRVKSGGKTSLGTALLETDELLFRGDFRVVIPFKEITAAKVDGEELVLSWKAAGAKRAASARFELGARAAKWLAKIRSPPTLEDKLGVTAESEVAMMGATAAALDEAFIAGVRAMAKSVREGAPAKSTSIAFLEVAKASELSRVAALRKKLRDDGALWIVYPKGRTEVREGDVIEAGRAAGFKDVKVARFSETHTALKFAIPLAERR